MTIPPDHDRHGDPVDMHAAALALAGRGIHVFPVRPGAKIPMVRWGSESTDDPAIINAWWSRWPAASIGVACGPSGLVVIDIDGPAGAESWAALTAEHGEVTTCAVTTGRDGGGRHLWFRAGPAPGVRNSAGLLGPGIDVRGTGGMVLAPPSLHRSGRRYAWAARAPLALLPDWLREAATPTPPARRPSRALPPVPADRLLVGLVRVVSDAPEGTRNDRLYWAGTRAAEHAAAGRLDHTTAVDALLRAAEAAGLPPGEAARTVRSALDGRAVTA
ncbi:bifunctional DNA primase/polymerase [Frankia sp. CiP1_Cm_nod2]|uniref:bifunctional DNA primase/polymerase n=1 Tax=Frankia sp. CiP1_Cm_nod2 TaxID=2897161 RepID=UPI0020253F2A